MTAPAGNGPAPERTQASIPGPEDGTDAAGGTQSFKWALLDGRTEVLSLGEDAQPAIFFKDGLEVGRVPVQLQVGRVNTVRL